MKKIILFIRLNIFYIFRNKMRLVLTTIGIGLGLLIFIIGNTAVSGYVRSLYAEAETFPQGSVIVANLSDSDIEKFSSVVSKYNLSTYDGPSEYVGTSQNYTSNKKIYENKIRMFGVDGVDIERGIPTAHTGRDGLCSTKLLYGRWICKQDSHNKEYVAVIERSVAIALFGKSNAIGETIEIYGLYGYIPFKVVGIVEDTYATRMNNLEINQQIKTKNVVEIDSCMYIPLSTYSMITKNDTCKNIITFDASYKEDAAEFFRKLATSDSFIRRGAYVISYDTEMNFASDIEYGMKGILNVGLAVLILITTFTIATIFIFSTKERFYEIGVRRAIGASRPDVLIQFMLEGIVYAVFSWIVFYFISVVVCNYMHVLFLNNLYLDYQFVISKKVAIASLGIAVLEGIVCSCTPAIIAANVRPTEAIRQD